jgi:hypothetical protein
MCTGVIASRAATKQTGPVASVLLAPFWIASPSARNDVLKLNREAVMRGVPGRCAASAIAAAVGRG